jgi:hypothetical protein
MRSECAIRYTHQCLDCISGLAVIRSLHSTCLSASVTDRVMEAWYHASIARMIPNRRVTWQATSDDENS